MKTYVTKLTLGLASVGLLSACVSSGELAQSNEYDDLYFTASDRNTVEFTKLNDPKKAEYQQGSYIYDQKSFSSKNVNPEYIARYNNAGDNQNISNQPNTQQNGEYYVEEFERDDFRTLDQPRVVNNFGRNAAFSTFGNPAFARMGWGAGAFYDPFFDPLMMDPFYDPFWGPSAFARPGWGWGGGINVGVNFGWGRPGWGRPGWGFGRPGWGFGNSWAFSPWRDPFYRPWGFGNAYAMGFYDGFYGSAWNRPGVVVINNNEGLGVNRRRVSTGVNQQRVSRANTDRNINGVRGRSVGDRNASSRSAAATNSRTRSSRDFTRSQNEYYQRSRNSARSAQAGRVYRSATPASRSSRTYSSSEATRSSRNGAYSRSRSTSPSRSYSRGSYGSSSRSSGSYNRGGSSGSYNRGSSGSRSSGSYGRSSGGSRSSGSYGRSSGGSSRSSGSSSGSRGSRGGGN